MSARSQVTLCAHGGGALEDVTASHAGSPERLIDIREEYQLVMGEKVPEGDDVPAAGDGVFAYSGA